MPVATCGVNPSTGLVCPSFIRSRGPRPARGHLTSGPKVLLRSSLVACSMPDETSQRASGVAAILQAGGTWEDIWKDGIEPGQKFDGARIAPFLAAKLSSGKLKVAGKNCLVPGCGRGYDCLAFAEAGALQAVGLELSPSAVERAEAFKKDLGLESDIAARSSFQQADFFDYPKTRSDKRPIDLGYDYTFLCALQPTQREAWAKTWAQVIAPDGHLVTLIFPVDPERTGGPPFPVTPEIYAQLLQPVGFEKVSLERIPDDMSHEGRGGKEYFGVWRRIEENRSSM